MNQTTLDQSPTVAPSALKEPVVNRALIDFAELVKARLTLLVLLTTAVGFYLATEGAANPLEMFHAIFGTALAAGGAAALNQWWERRLDGLMHRTKARPIPSGRMPSRDACVIGTTLSLAGIIYLALACNGLSAFLAALTIAIYIFGYTPLKRVTTANTLVGAIPGALPPVIGWTAARGELGWGAWSLFAILFAWQMPHFFAIAWMYREDYARAGFRMLSGSDVSGARSGRQSIFFCLLLMLASICPAQLGLTTASYLPIALLFGCSFLALAIHFHLRRAVMAARILFIGSVVYLPALLVALVFTKK